jgi:hypothetical protein
MRHNTCEECGHYTWAHNTFGCFARISIANLEIRFKYTIQERGKPDAEMKTGHFPAPSIATCPCTKRL